MDQLLLFQETREEKLEREVIKLKELCERTRKSQYAKISELSKLYHDTKHEIETLKSAMCRNWLSERRLQSTIFDGSDIEVA